MLFGSSARRPPRRNWKYITALAAAALGGVALLARLEARNENRETNRLNRFSEILKNLQRLLTTRFQKASSNEPKRLSSFRRWSKGGSSSVPSTAKAS